MEFVIPEELLVNILVRLPIKDVLRSKLIQKSCLRLISSSSEPCFTSFFARNSPFTLIFRVQNNFENPNKLFFSLLEFSAGKLKHIPITPPEIPKVSNSSSLSFIGSCNGSAFILHQKHFSNDHAVYRVYSFNPVLGSCVKLVVDDRIGKSEPLKYMVGFIPSNNTYKLLRFRKVPGFEKAEKPEIFTVGGLNWNWRKVDAPLLFCGAFNAHTYARVICFNGAYHWLSSSDGDDDKIFTFNLLEEKSGTRIPKPSGMSLRLSNITTRLTILEDRLSVVELSEDDNKTSIMVIWRMEEYGVVESWSKVIVLPLFQKGPEKSRNCKLVPIAVLGNGDILFSDKSSRGGMCFYNLEERRLTPIHNDHPDSSSGLSRVYEDTYLPRFYT